MSQEKPEFLAEARHALDKLVDQFLDHPDVSFIDIGYLIEHGQIVKQIVLRIHVREHWIKAKPEERTAFPSQVDNIPVIVMFGDYRLEANTPATDRE